MYHIQNVKPVKCEVHVRDFSVIGKTEDGKNVLDSFVMKLHTVAMTYNNYVPYFCARYNRNFRILMPTYFNAWSVTENSHFRIWGSMQHGSTAVLLSV